MIILKNRITLGIVANANNDLILKTIMDAESQKLINPVLIGNIEFMTAFIDKHEWSLSKDKLIAELFRRRVIKNCLW